MAVTPQISSPGVYIEELPSGVQTIAGAPTAITAFIGRAPRGPVDEPTLIANYSEYDHIFDGLDVDHPLSYAVNDFFANGGSLAMIVRVYISDSGNGAASVRLKAESGADSGPMVEAANPGAWSNGYKISVDREGITKAVAKDLGVQAASELFNLKVWNPHNQVVESFINLSIEETATRRLDRVLAQESALVRVAVLDDRPDLGTATPAETSTKAEADLKKLAVFSGGEESEFLNSPQDFLGSEEDQTGIYALEKADIFNILCIPPDGRSGSGRQNVSDEVFRAAAKFCEQRRAFLIVDPQQEWGQEKSNAVAAVKQGLADLNLTAPEARNAALYFPRVIMADPLSKGQPDTFAPCGIIAGIIADTDDRRGVWSAPAGTEAVLNGIEGLQVDLSDMENGELKVLGINCLRDFRVYGTVAWGARTLRGADQMSDDYKYIPVRRLTLYVQESLYRGTQWAVFEPNDEPLWAQLRTSVGEFMHDLFRQGAFRGQSSGDSYFVNCDSTTTTQSDIHKGIVNIVVGFAPFKPAEFVVLYIQQSAGAIPT